MNNNITYLKEEAEKVLAEKSALDSTLYLSRLESIAQNLANCPESSCPKSTEFVIREIAEILNSAPADKYFETLTNELCNKLNATAVFIGEISDSSKIAKIRTLVFSKKGEIIPNISYQLKHTPCEQVIEKTIKTFESGVKKLFPHACCLKDIDAESYSGVTLKDTNGQPKGLLVAFFANSLENKELVETVLSLFARQASIEIERQQTLEALTNSEKRYQQITDTITDYIVKVQVVDGHVVNTMHGANCKAVTGYSVEDYENDPYLWYKMIHQLDREEVIEKTEKIIEGKEIKPFEHRIYHKNGSVRWIKNNPVVFRNEDDEIFEYDEVISDITDLKIAEEAILESEEKYRKLVEYSPDTICIFTDLKLVYVSNAGLELLGIATHEEIIGIELAEIFHPYYKTQILEDALNCLKTNEAIRSKEVLIEKRDQTNIEAEISIIPLLYKNQPSIQVVFRDISERKKTALALRRSEERFSLAMEAVNDGIFEWNLQNGEMFFSARSYLMIGYAPFEFEPTHLAWNNLIHPDDKPQLYKLVSDHIKGEISSYEIEYRIKTKTGEYKWILERGKLLEKSSQNEPQKIIGVHSDIDLKKQTEENIKKEKDFVERIMQISPVGIITCDKDLKVVFANDQAEKILDFRYSQEGDHIMPFWRFFNHYGNELRFKQLPFWRSMLEHKPIIDDRIIIQFPDSRRIVVSINANPLFDSQAHFDGSIITINDISKQTAAEEALISEKEHAQESDRLKSAFLANMSHEIRTPMNGIIGFAGLLSKENLLPDKRQKYIKVIQNSTNQLLAIITDILDISKIEAGQMNILGHNFNLNSLIDELLEQFEVERKIRNKLNLELHIQKSNADEEIEIFADKARLSQVISNLIGNAMKFTENGFIEFGYKILSSEMLVFYVKDTGIGIPRDKLALIFERFRQGDDSTTRKFGGTGLGLAICRGLVELMGGKIWVESDGETGSTFYFTIKFNPVAGYKNKNIEQIQDTKNSFDWSAHTILVVEDVVDNYLLIEEILAETKANILYAPDGYLAIEALEKNSKIDLILMDIQLPGMNGYETTRKIKATKPDLIIIAQTAYGLVGDREKALESGCDEYISKPIIRDKLLQVIDNSFCKNILINNL